MMVPWELYKHLAMQQLSGKAKLITKSINLWQETIDTELKQLFEAWGINPLNKEEIHRRCRKETHQIANEIWDGYFIDGYIQLISGYMVRDNQIFFNVMSPIIEG